MKFTLHRFGEAGRKALSDADTSTHYSIHLMCVDSVVHYCPAYSSCIQWQTNRPIAGTVDS
jgi:hypothetical protein